MKDANFLHSLVDLDLGAVPEIELNGAVDFKMRRSSQGRQHQECLEKDQESDHEGYFSAY